MVKKHLHVRQMERAFCPSIRESRYLPGGSTGHVFPVQLGDTSSTGTLEHRRFAGLGALAHRLLLVNFLLVPAVLLVLLVGRVAVLWFVSWSSRVTVNE